MEIWVLRNGWFLGDPELPLVAGLDPTLEEAKSGDAGLAVQLMQWK